MTTGIRFVLSMTPMLAVAAQFAAGQTTLDGFQAREQERRQQFLALSAEVYAGPESPMAARQEINSIAAAKLDELTRRLHELLTAQIEDVLSVSDWSSEAVRLALKEVLGGASLAEWDTRSTNGPIAVLSSAGGGRTMAVAYGMLRGAGAIPNCRSYLEFYTLERGRAIYAAGIGPDLVGRTFFVSAVPAGVASQAWFLVWGREIGDTGGRLRVRLYAFDGETVRTVWQRDNLVWGDVTVAGRAVTLEYDREYHSLERVRETLYVEPDGLGSER